jgi:diguanylate cyclase (GGDEF)-like protein
VRPPLIRLALPEGLIVLAAAAMLRWPGLLEPAAPFLPALPPLVLAAGVALALRFGRSSVLLGLVVLALADRAVLAASPQPALRQLVSFLAPLNLAALALLPERGLLTVAAARRAGAIAAQVVLAVLLTRPDETGVAAALDATLFPGWLTGWTPLGDPALVAFAVALAAALLRFRQSDATARGFFWAAVTLLLALSAPAGGPAAAIAPSTLLFTAAGLVLTTAVVEASHALAYQDGLTGLGSRRAFDDALKAADGPFTVAMVDVDHFKRCNDTYGHEVGDQVLRKVAAALARVNAGGRSFRYGGEEFAVLFPGRDRDSCLPALEAARHAIEHTAFTLRAADRPKRRPKKPVRRSSGRQVVVTVSIGVADRTPPDLPPEAVVRAADEALYKAKKTGRNRVAV